MICHLVTTKEIIAWGSK